MAAIALLIVLSALVLSLYALSIKNEAASILADISKIKVGSSTASEVETFAEKHKRYLRRRDRRADWQEYFFEVRNTWLSILHIAPQARFSAWVSVMNGTAEIVGAVVMRDTPLSSTISSGGMVEEHVQYPERYSGGETHYGFPTPIGKPYLVVSLDLKATAEQREHAYALSLKCLVKPGGGCDLPCDYLPLAWKDWESQLSAQGGFGEHYSSRQRCK